MMVRAARPCRLAGRYFRAPRTRRRRFDISLLRDIHERIGGSEEKVAIGACRRGADEAMISGMKAAMMEQQAYLRAISFGDDDFGIRAIADILR